MPHVSLGCLKHPNWRQTYTRLSQTDSVLACTYSRGPSVEYRASTVWCQSARSWASYVQGFIQFKPSRCFTCSHGLLQLFSGLSSRDWFGIPHMQKVRDIILIIGSLTHSKSYYSISTNLYLWLKEKDKISHGWTTKLSLTSIICCLHVY